MHRTVSVAVMLSVTGLAATACGGGSSQHPASEPPPLAQVSTPPPPAAIRPAGPAITAACPLLKPTQLTAAGLRNTKPTETSPVAALHTCHYQAGAQYVELMVSTTPASGTADQAASLAIKRYTGTLRSIPRLGDAAYYTGTAGSSPTVQTVVVSRAEGTQMRLITLIGFLKGDAMNRMTALIRVVLTKV